MQIKPPTTPSSSGVSTTGSSGASAADKAARAENPLAKLVGQVVNAQVVQSKAIQIATAQAALLQAGISARLSTEPRDQRTSSSTQSTPATSSSATPTSTSATATASSTPSQNTVAPGAAQNSATTQTQYQTTLQIGNERVVVVSEQPLPPGAQVALKVTSPQAVQLLQQAAPAAPPETPDIAGNLLNTLLRQALPLQQPVARLLATIASDLLLNSRNATPASAGSTSNPLASIGVNVPAGVAPAVAAALKPLLTQIVNAQLNVNNITEPDALRTAVTNSGLFREARLVQWAQALLKQFPDALTRGIPSSGQNASGNLSTAASLLQNATQGMNPAGAPLAGAAATQAAASILLPQSTTASPQTPTGQSAAVADSVDVLDPKQLAAKQLETLRNATAAGNNTASGPSQNAAGANSAGASQAADITDVDALRNELLKALSARAQKNQAAFANPSTTAAVTAEAARTATSATPAGTGLPINAKTATSALPLDTSVTADTKTTLEKLVSLTSQQLLSSSGKTTHDTISEEHVLAILRQLPMPSEPQVAAKSKSKSDDDQWLLQLLRSSFGALKHLQLQQATNLNAAPTAQQGMESPVAPLQIELPILVAQQWHSVNIEIDRRTPENRAEANQNERSWRVTLRFELPLQGVIVAQLNLAGVHVNATLWAEKQATCAQLQQQLKDLSDRLGKVGAHVTTLDVRHGQPLSAKTRIEQRLIDIRT